MGLIYANGVYENAGSGYWRMKWELPAAISSHFSLREKSFYAIRITGLVDRLGRSKPQLDDFFRSTRFPLYKGEKYKESF